MEENITQKKKEIAARGKESLPEQVKLNKLTDAVIDMGINKELTANIKKAQAKLDAQQLVIQRADIAAEAMATQLGKMQYRLHEETRLLHKNRTDLIYRIRMDPAPRDAFDKMATYGQRSGTYTG